MIDEQQTTDLDYLKEGARFIRKSGNFDHVLVIASKSTPKGSERYDWVDGNFFAAYKCAELYVDEQGAEPAEEVD